MKKLIMERSFNASIEDVWNAFTAPETLKQWWSPEGMSSSFISVDLKVGGVFRYCFKMDEGEMEFWGRGIYQKIEKPNYLSYKDCFTDSDGRDVAASHYGIEGDEILETDVEFFFSSDGQKTTIKMVGENPFDEKMTADMTEGWNGMFNKLGKMLDN